MPYANSVTAEIFVKAGSRYEPIPGISHFLEHMIDEGSQNYPSPRDIRKIVKKHGAMTRFSTYKDYVSYRIKVPSEHKVFSFQFLKELLFNPLIAHEAIEKEKKIILREIAQLIDDTFQYTIYELLPRHIWGRDHPLGRSALGSKKSITSISRNDLVDFHQKFYTPSNIVLAVAGNVDADEVFELSERHFGDLLQTTQEQKTSTIFNLPYNRGILVQKRNSQQSSIAISIATNITFPDNDFAALVVLNNLIGNQIFYKFIYDLGICYVADALPINVSTDNSELIFIVQVSPEKTEKAFKLLVNEMKNAEINNETLEEAKNDAKRILFLTISDTDEHTGFIGMQEILYGDVKSPQQMKMAVDHVSLEDVDRLKREWISEEHSGSVILGPVKTSLKKKLSNTWAKN
jgi:predicted Zn-dependent peptidase